MLAAHHRSAVVDARLDLAKPASPTRRLTRLSGAGQVLGDGMAAAGVSQLRFESVFVHIAGRLGRQNLAQRRAVEAHRRAEARPRRFEERAALSDITHDILDIGLRDDTAPAIAVENDQIEIVELDA